jgi:hypothetical protein
MILTEKALAKINNRETILKLAFVLGFTEIWIVKLIAKNKPNGDLTTAAALRVIKEETDLLEEEILEEEKVEAQR